ncbi:MAG: dihydroneopterin aldolase [Chlorobi bacterium]|nr:dihydroneopterin aldolase [Chlorobiota bacterium]
MDIIRLRGIRLFARHGCLDEEQVLGAEFELNLTLELDLSEAGRSGHIEDTVDYAAVYALIYREMQKREKLLERAAYRIARKILETFDRVQRVECALAKLHPPLPGQIERSEVVIRLDRKDVLS